MDKYFYSNGKLLLTGEYAVLNGALSLAIPTKYGQSLMAQKIDDPVLHWKSLDEKGSIWFQTSIQLADLNNSVLGTEENSVRATLVKILSEAQKLNPEFVKKGGGFDIETKMTFPKSWGLGSSSTLINNIAQWAKIDPYQLLWNSLGGSGYDIACAQNGQPILYHLEDRKPMVKKVVFKPTFKDSLYFVYLNKKQNSREGIANYEKCTFDREKLAQKITLITQKIVVCPSLKDFEKLIGDHESLISEVLNSSPIKENLFPDYFGAIKSLGAWGGDFALATGNHKTLEYFKEKGYETIIPYSRMVLS